MKKGILSGKYFWEFYYYDVNVKKNFSNFSKYTTGSQDPAQMVLGVAMTLWHEPVGEAFLQTLW